MHTYMPYLLNYHNNCCHQFLRDTLMSLSPIKVYINATIITSEDNKLLLDKRWQPCYQSQMLMLMFDKWQLTSDIHTLIGPMNVLLYSLWFLYKFCLCREKYLACFCGSDPDLCVFGRLQNIYQNSATDAN